MQESIAQLFYDIAGNVFDWARPVSNQIALAIVVTIGLIMWTLSAVFPLRDPEAPDEWNNDVAPWPLAAPEREGTVGDGGGADHVALSKLCSGEEL